jgi:hypothetical protein
MGSDPHDDVGIVLDQEIKAPGLVDARLPEILAFVVFLGVEREG